VATGFNRDGQRTPLAINILTEESIWEPGFNSYQEMSEFIPSASVEPSNLDGNSNAFARGHARASTRRTAADFTPTRSSRTGSGFGVWSLGFGFGVLKSRDCLR
jgi:hypothetical protein